MERFIRRNCGSNCVNQKTCLRRWHTARRNYLPKWTAGACASVINVCCIFMTGARRGNDAGAACSFVGIGLKLRLTPLDSVGMLTSESATATEPGDENTIWKMRSWA